MKKTFLSLILFSLIITTVQKSDAQSWSLTGNSGTNQATNFIGTNDNKNLLFRTNNLERMRISKDGTIGIGGNNNSGYILNVHANSTLGGINITDPLDHYVLHSSKSGNGYAIYVAKTSATDSSATIYRLNSGSGACVYGHSTSGYGVYGYTEKGGNLEDPIAVSGVYGYNPSYGYGVGGYCFKGSGIYGYSAKWIGIFGDIGNSDYYAGYFNGDIYATGSYLPSGQNLKQDITDVSDAMNIINQLHPKHYQYRQDGNYQLMNLPKGKRYGLIAEDVEKVLPGLVKESKYKTKMYDDQLADPKNSALITTRTSETINFKALNYVELIPIMIKGMQEMNDKLQQQIQEQQQRIDKLEKIIEKLSANSNISSSNLSSESNGAYLKQNTPNPFTQNTIIYCNIPPSAKLAQLIIYNENGNRIKSFDLTNGINNVTITAASFSSGQYVYSLFIDGKNIESKKMILTK